MNQTLSFLRGLASPIDGFRLFFRHASIRKLIYLPLIVSFGIFTLGIVWFFSYMGSFYHRLQEPLMMRIEPELSKYVDPEVIEMSLSSVDLLLKTAVYVIGFVILIFLLFMIMSVLCGVFWEMLADEVSRLYGTPSQVPTDFWSKWIVPMFREFIKQILFGGMLLVSYLSGWLPGIGWIISLLIAPLVITIWFAFMICDHWFTIQGYPLRLRWRLIWKQLLYMLGLGSYLVLPLIGFVLYPFFVIGTAYHWTKFYNPEN